MANTKDFATKIQPLQEWFGSYRVSSDVKVGRKGYGFRLCDNRRKVLSVDGMTVHVAPAKLRDKYGDVVIDSDGHPVRCVPEALFKNAEDGDPYKDFREEIAAFMRDEVPFGDWKVGQVEFDPSDVAEWKMASEWSPAKVRKWCHEHPYWLAWWQPSNLVDTDVDDLASVEDFFCCEVHTDIDEVI